MLLDLEGESQGQEGSIGRPRAVTKAPRTTSKNKMFLRRWQR